MNGRKKDAARGVFLRFVATNMLILIPPFVVAAAYYFVSVRTIVRAADATAELQLEGDVAFVDRGFQEMERATSQLVVDYDLNRLLNVAGSLDDVEMYESKRISDLLASMATSNTIFERCMLYLVNSDRIIYESGFADYENFYGTLMNVEGYDAPAWRAAVLASESTGTAFMPGLQASLGGKVKTYHFFVRSIGRGEYMRGAVVYAIAAEEFGRKLSLLSRLYGGRVVALDGAGRLLASTDGEALLTDEELGSLDRPVVSSGGERFRVYTRNSAYNDWRYVAVISEKRITAAAIRTRNTAFVLLGAGFLIALGISYAVASSNTRPLSRIFALLLPPQEATLTRASGVYARVEDAILALSDSKRQLESEASSAASVVRTYFLQKLLRGEYRSRQPFAEDRSRFSVPLSSGPYFVLSCRLSSLAAALDGDERGEALAELQRACSALVSEDEHAVGVSAGEVAVLLRAGDDYRSVASDIVERVRSRLTEGRRDGVVFGVGTPVDDPFLLPISYGEAEAAVSAAGPELRKPMRLYEDLPSSEGTYRYPLDVEEAIVKAVRSANTLLLDSLMDGVREANFVARALHPSEAEKLVSALKGTVYRLLSELPEAGRAASASEPAGKESLRSIVDRLDSSESVEDAFAAVSAALHSLAEERDRGKRSHNATLAAAVRDYVASRFRDFNLSLSSVADVFDLSENYLSSFFKEQEGESLSEYIQRKRMSEASKLLSEATASVDAIAANCGYPNVASFRRAFKRVYGVSPSEYRNGRTAERGQL